MDFKLSKQTLFTAKILEFQRLRALSKQNTRVLTPNFTRPKCQIETPKKRLLEYRAFCIKLRAFKQSKQTLFTAKTLEFQRL